MFRYTLSHNVEGTYVLPHDPKGWEDSKFSILRSPKYHGMNYAQILSLAFICGSGKEFIDNIYDNYGIDEEITILIEESCECDEIITSNSYNSDYNGDYEHGGSIIDCNFEEVFTGLLDLKEIVKLDEETQVPLIEQGLNQKFNSRAETKIDLFKNETIGGGYFTNINQPYDLNMHSKAISSLGNYEFIDYEAEQFFSTTSWGLVITQIPVVIEKEGLYFGDEILFENTSSGPIDVKFKIDSVGGLFIQRFGAGFRLTQFGLKMGTDPITSGFTWKWVPDQNIFYDGLVFVDFTVSSEIIIAVPAGLTVWLSVTVDAPFGEDWLVNSAFTKLTILGTYVSVTEPSVAKAQKVFESLSRICQGILDIADPVRSDYYGRIGATPFSNDSNGCGSFAAFTSTHMIRQFPAYGDKTRTISISMSEVFDSLDAIDNIGVGFEKWGNDYKLRWERKNFFYQDIEILHLQHVPKIKIRVAKEYAYNNINIGFEEWQTSSANGLDEYCAKSQYSLGLKSIDQPLEKISPILASAYIVESIRRMPYSETSTTDTDFDDKNFIIALNRSTDSEGVPNALNIAEKNENFISVENVLSPETTYNLRYTTSKNLLRNVPSISPIITKYSGRNIKFTEGQGNKFIITQDAINCPSYYNGQKLAGNQDVAWDDKVEEPLFVAEYLEFEYPISRSQFMLIKNAFNKHDAPAHNGYITVSNEEETIKGFLMELNYSQKDGLTTFKLIRKYD